MNQEQWTEDMLESLQYTRHVQAPAALKQKIMQRVHTATIIKLPLAIRCSIAAGVALLIATNIYAFTAMQAGNDHGQNTNGTALIVNEYFNNDINL